MKIYSSTEVLGKYFDWDKIPEDILAQACERGTDVHSGCAMYAKLGYAGSHAPDRMGYIKSFRDWFDRNVEEVLLVEKRLVDEKLGFKGKPDFVFKLITGEVVLQDIKTPLAEQTTWKCQLASYWWLVENEAKIKLDDLMSLRLRPDGGPALGVRYKGSRLAAFNAFCSMLNGHRYIYG